MYLVIFARDNGVFDSEKRYNSLAMAMRAIGRWLADTDGKGTVEISYEG